MDAKRSSPTIAPLLLAWYDVHRRVLPWRALPGEAVDPYRVWLSEIMLQQTTVATVAPRFEAWIARWPTLESLAAADEAEVMAAWAGLGYYARARNLVAAARVVVATHGGRFPASESALRALPGLGAYTAAAVAAIGFDERAVVIDGNVERVVARLFAIVEPLPGARAAIRAAADAITPDARAGDFAQAMMDLGSGICTPRAPRCLACPLREACAGFAGDAPERLPVKAAKRARALRFGTVFWLERLAPASSPAKAGAQFRGGGDRAPAFAGEGIMGEVREVYLIRRPAKGLLGGMRALPTGPWQAEPPLLADAPAGTDWMLLDAQAAHSFTHFDLILALAVAHATDSPDFPGEWWPVAALADAGLPTVFAKAAGMIERSRQCGSNSL